MSDPIQTCQICLRSRNCMLHANGKGFPPDKAEKWLLRTCPLGKKLCQINYRAGIAQRSSWTGQSVT